MGGPSVESERLRAIVAMQAAINDAEPTAAEVMHLVAERSQVLTNADAAVVELAEGADMVYRAATGSAAAHLGLRLAVATSLSGRCVTTGQVMRCDDSDTDPRVDREACRRIGARSMIVVPLQRKAEVVGVLKVLSGRPHAFGAEEVELLEVMAGFIAAAISRAARFDVEAKNARCDPLTGLANRAFLAHRLHEAIVRARRSGAGVGVVFLDLDRFKPINDTYGHRSGDEVLKAVAGRIAGTVRTADLAARIGGDEFVVLCEPATERLLRSVIKRLEAAVRRPIVLAGVVVDLGASFGCALASGGDSADRLLARADEAMYAMKGRRRAPVA